MRMLGERFFSAPLLIQRPRVTALLARPSLLVSAVLAERGILGLSVVLLVVLVLISLLVGG